MFASEVGGKKPPNSPNQAWGKKYATTSQASGTHTIEKTKKIGHKPRFP